MQLENTAILHPVDSEASPLLKQTQHLSPHYKMRDSCAKLKCHTHRHTPQQLVPSLPDVEFEGELGFASMKIIQAAF